jgi:hypothetical protein
MRNKDGSPDGCEAHVCPGTCLDLAPDMYPVCANHDTRRRGILAIEANVITSMITGSSVTDASGARLANEARTCESITRESPVIQRNDVQSFVSFSCWPPGPHPGDGAAGDGAGLSPPCFFLYAVFTFIGDPRGPDKEDASNSRVHGAQD